MQIKRTFTFIENIDVEAGKQINPPLRKIAVAAIVDVTDTLFGESIARLRLTHDRAEMRQRLDCHAALRLDHRESW